MRVGILGSGVVGQTLGTGFVEHGDEVRIGTRNPGKPELVAWQRSTHGKGSVGSFADAAGFGEILVVACLGSAAEEVVGAAGPKNFDGKLVIDATNALDFSRGMPPGLFVAVTDSLSERLQRRLPGARLVKCFNIVPAPLMVRPSIAGSTPTMMIAGNDAAAKKQVESILRAWGWTDVLDLGAIDAARGLEMLVYLWVRVAGSLRNFNVAFRVLA